MITTRTAKQCGQADFGWLQARYTFSFGHYFDPKLLGYASLRVLNQEVLAPGASFQPRTYPKVDILNLIPKARQNTAIARAIMSSEGWRGAVNFYSAVLATVSITSAKTKR